MPGVQWWYSELNCKSKSSFESWFPCHYSSLIFPTGGWGIIISVSLIQLNSLHMWLKNLNFHIINPAEFSPQVAEHQEVCVLEAMKMQNSLVSAKIGKVSSSQALTIVLQSMLLLFVHILLSLFSSMLLLFVHILLSLFLYPCCLMMVITNLHLCHIILLVLLFTKWPLVP